MNQENNSDTSSIVPVKWLEAKLHLMRKLAIENNKSLKIDSVDIAIRLSEC